MKEKVKVSKVKLRKVEEESATKEADMHKVYDLVHRLQKQIKDMKAAAENTGKEDEAGCSPFQLIFVICDLFIEE